jgi:uncharacterized damage-inducible protein DinB
VSAIDRCSLTFNVLLEFTSKEHHKWHDWFVSHPGAWEVPFATGRMATVGGLVHHIFGVELRYTQRLRDQRVIEWDEFNETSIEDVFALGDNARGQLGDFLTSASAAELEKILTFKTYTAGEVTVSKHKIASNIFLHGIRHWGQVATAMRQNEFTDEWPHDLLLSDVIM